MTSDSDRTRDERITQAIEREIHARMRTNASPMNAAVQGATVTLTGHAASQATEDATIQMARTPMASSTSPTTWL